jgi:molybdenum cofactor cytidylyltransferase
MSEPFVAGLVLAAGGAHRLGRPKPLLPYAGATLLDHALATARACDFDQLLVAVGIHEKKMRARVDLSGADVVNSLAGAINTLDPATTVLVLLRGDQPGVTPATVRVLLAARGDAAVTVCRYDDGRGHPYVFRRSAFGDLRDKSLKRVLAAREREVEEVPMAGPVPLDVNSWADYETVVASAGHDSFTAETAGGWRRGFRD